MLGQIESIRFVQFFGAHCRVGSERLQLALLMHKQGIWHLLFRPRRGKVPARLKKPCKHALFWICLGLTVSGRFRSFRPLIFWKENPLQGIEVIYGSICGN